VIALTTCRKPSRNLRIFARNLSNSIPNVVRFNRGKISIKELIDKLKELGSDRLILVYRKNGNPGTIKFYKLINNKLKLSSPIILLEGVNFAKQRDSNHQCRKKYSAELISFENSLEKESLKFLEKVSDFLKLPLLPLNSYWKCKVSLHFSMIDDSIIKIALTSPPGESEVGLSLLINKSNVVSK
jgi:rRNA maturation protein Rpf1